MCDNPAFTNKCLKYVYASIKVWNEIQILFISLSLEEDFRKLTPYGLNFDKC